MRYGKVVNGKVVYADAKLVLNGRVYYTRNKKLLLKKGYMPVNETPPTTDAEHYAEIVGVKEEKDQIVFLYEIREVKKPPRRFSKLQTILVLSQMGLWEAVREWIQKSGLNDVYLATTDFSEDNAYFEHALHSLKEELHLTDAQVESILASAEVIS